MKKKIAVFVCSLFILLACIVGSSLAKSYSLKSLSSEVSIEGCTFNVIEYFEYEFDGTYSRIGRPFYSTYSLATNISVTILSNSNGINSTTISASIQIIDETQYFIMNMNPSTPDNAITRISFKLSYTFHPKGSLFYKFINTGLFSNETYFQVGYYYSNTPPIENLISTLILPNVKYVINPEPVYLDGYTVTREMVNNLTARFTQRMSSSLKPYVKFLPLVTTPFDECAFVINNNPIPDISKDSKQRGLIAFEIFAIVAGSLAGVIIIVSCTAFCIVLKRINPRTKDASWFFFIRTSPFCWCFHGNDVSSGGGDGGGGGGDSEMNTGYTSFNDNSNDYSNSNNWDSGGGGGGNDDNWGSSGGGGGGGSGFAD